MLKVLRKKGIAKKILWFVAIIIIISFGFFGTASILDNPKGITYAGKIFGQKISFDEFEKNYRMTYIQALLQYGENFNRLRDFLNLNAQTWDRLILLYEVKKRRIKVDDENVVKMIQGFPFFQINGQFNPTLYNDILKNVLHSHARDFEEGIRDSLRFAKLSEEVTSDVTISEEEIHQEYERFNKKVQVSFILFPFEEYQKNIPTHEDALKTYFQEHQKEFVVSPAVNIQYLNIEYSPEADEAQKQITEEKAYTIFEELQTDADFSKAAEKYNLKLQTSDFFSLDKPDLKTTGWSLDILSALSKLNIGEITPPLQAHNGFQILKLLEKKQPDPTLELVKDQVIQAWTMQEAKKQAYAKAEENLETVKIKLANQKETNFIEIANQLSFKVEQTPPFNQGQYLPIIGLSEEFQQEAFKLTAENPLSKVIETSKGYCFLNFDASFPIEEEKYNQEKENYKKALLDQRRAQAFSDFLTHLRIKANIEDNISKLRPQPSSSSTP